LRVAVTQRLDQSGRPLDIGEQERDRPARKPAHSAAPPPTAGLRGHGRHHANATAMAAATPVTHTPGRGPRPPRAATRDGCALAPAPTTGASPHASSQRRPNPPPAPSTRRPPAAPAARSPPASAGPGQGQLTRKRVTERSFGAAPRPQQSSPLAPI